MRKNLMIKILFVMLNFSVYKTVKFKMTKIYSDSSFEDLMIMLEFAKLHQNKKK